MDPQMTWSRRCQRYGFQATTPQDKLKAEIARQARLRKRRQIQSTMSPALSYSPRDSEENCHYDETNLSSESSRDRAVLLRRFLKCPSPENGSRLRTAWADQGVLEWPWCAADSPPGSPLTRRLNVAGYGKDLDLSDCCIRHPLGSKVNLSEIDDDHGPGPEFRSQATGHMRGRQIIHLPHDDQYGRLTEQFDDVSEWQENQDNNEGPGYDVTYLDRSSLHKIADGYPVTRVRVLYGEPVVKQQLSCNLERHVTKAKHRDPTKCDRRKVTNKKNSRAYPEACMQKNSVESATQPPDGFSLKSDSKEARSHTSGARNKKKEDQSHKTARSENGHHEVGFKTNSRKHPKHNKASRPSSREHPATTATIKQTSKEKHRTYKESTKSAVKRDRRSRSRPPKVLQLILEMDSQEAKAADCSRDSAEEKKKARRGRHGRSTCPKERKEAGSQTDFPGEFCSNDSSVSSAPVSSDNLTSDDGDTEDDSTADAPACDTAVIIQRRHSSVGVIPLCTRMLQTSRPPE